MDKEKAAGDEFEDALRAIAEQRDRSLGEVSSLPPARRVCLRALLSQEFPIEVALEEVAVRRDRALEESPPAIPRSAARALRLELATATSEGETASLWRRCLPAPAAALLTAACLFLAIVIAALPTARRASVAQSSSPSLSVPVASQNEFRLRVSASELAALRASFIAANTSASTDDPLPLRLDLPVRALLGNDASMSTP